MGRAWRRLAAAPLWLRVTGLAAAGFVVFSATNLVYHVVRKPTEMLLPVSGVLNKAPEETWRDYGSLFRRYATPIVTPELLAALAQVEGAGNPVAHTYWRWRLSWHPFAIYAPASSAVGMYQMTDPAFAEARRYCIRDHAVLERECWLNSLYTRIIPSHAVELTAALLDRKASPILAAHPKALEQQKEDLAAVIHLCGAGPGRDFARRGFRALPAEQCGDHEVARYLARINAMKERFRKLAEDRQK
jgi:hypothetical protein